MKMFSAADRIAAFGMELKPLEEADLPLLHHWRNHPDILPFMDDPRPVPSRALSVWFHKIRSSGATLPYLVHQGRKAIAYTEIKDIDRQNSSCEGGLFVFGQDYIGTGIAYTIILAREIVTDALNLQTLFSRVQDTNTRGISFCVKYGGEYLRRDGDFLVYRYEFARRREKLQAIAAILGMAGEYARRFAGGRA